MGIIFLNSMTTMCACGHTSWVSIPANLAGAVMLGWIFLKGKDNRVVTRSLVMSGILVSTLALAKNVVDILWLGHAPLF